MAYPASAQSKGGQVTAIKQRKEAIRRYYENPNRCAFCLKVIEVQEEQKVAQVRQKKYCNSSCAAKSSNKGRCLAKKEYVCGRCGKEFARYRMPSGNLTKRKYCERCELIGPSGNKTKGQLAQESRDYFSFRCTITTYAQKIFAATSKSSKCVVCGYSAHIEVCHMKPVSEFSDDATIWEINHPDNLVGLCPNHHWELDNGFLSLAG